MQRNAMQRNANAAQRKYSAMQRISIMQRNYCGGEYASMANAHQWQMRIRHAVMANAHHAYSNNEYGFLPTQIHDLSRNDFSNKKSANTEK